MSYLKLSTFCWWCSPEKNRLLPVLISKSVCLLECLSFRIWGAFISLVLTLACLPAICPCLHRCTVWIQNLRFFTPPGNKCRWLITDHLACKQSGRGFPAYQSLCCLFCSLNPRHENIERAMSSHSHAPNFRNSSCCPKFHLKYTHRGKEDTARF